MDGWWSGPSIKRRIRIQSLEDVRKCWLGDLSVEVFWHFRAFSCTVSISSIARVYWIIVTGFYSLAWEDIEFHRFTSSFSNRCGYSASTRIRIRCVFKSFHSGERFQKFAVTVCVFAGYVWTISVTATKCLRIQTNPDTCGRGLKRWMQKHFVYYIKIRVQRSIDSIISAVITCNI